VPVTPDRCCDRCCQERGLPKEAEMAYREAADAGRADAHARLGVLLCGAGEAGGGQAAVCARRRSRRTGRSVQTRRPPRAGGPLVRGRAAIPAGGTAPPRTRALVELLDDRERGGPSPADSTSPRAMTRQSRRMNSQRFSTDAEPGDGPLRYTGTPKSATGQAALHGAQVAHAKTRTANRRWL
jgi:hypothetical protein